RAELADVLDTVGTLPLRRAPLGRGDPAPARQPGPVRLHQFPPLPAAGPAARGVGQVGEWSGDRLRHGTSAWRKEAFVCTVLYRRYFGDRGYRHEFVRWTASCEGAARAPGVAARSEERRVGKECRGWGG